jgi:Bacterial Ig-like domain (group 2)
MRLASFVAAGILVAGLPVVSCGPTGPSSSSNSDSHVIGLSIRPAIDAMRIGESEMLVAAEQLADGRTTTVEAIWSTDSPGVASVAANGEVRAVSLGSVTVRATFGTLATSMPLRVVSDFSGNWAGKYHVTSCTRQSGGGPDFCRALLFPPGATFPMTLVVSQTHGTVTATLNLYDNTGRRLVETGSLTGTVNESNQLVLSGSTTGVNPSEPQHSIVSSWTSSLDSNGTAQAGRFAIISSSENAWGPQVIEEGCDLTDFSRVTSGS